MALYCGVKVSVGTTGLVLGTVSMTLLCPLADEALKFWPAEEDFESSGPPVRQMSRQVGVGSCCLLTFQRMTEVVNKTRSTVTLLVKDGMYLKTNALSLMIMSFHTAAVLLMLLVAYASLASAAMAPDHNASDPALDHCCKIVMPFIQYPQMKVSARKKHSVREQRH